jgi:thioredoxin 1
MALAITDANYERILAEGKPVVIDFWAEWCGPCRMVGPIVEELADEYAGRVVVGKCDVDENNDIASKFGIRNIPTLLFFRDGVLADRHVGYAPKSELAARVENLLK